MSEAEVPWPHTNNSGHEQNSVQQGFKWKPSLMIPSTGETFRLLMCLKNLSFSFCFFKQDIGKSILESYSRVLESLAFNIVARIDDLLYADGMAKCSIQKGKRNPNPCSGTPFATPSFSPSLLVSPAREERSPFNRKTITLGLGVKKVLTDYLGIEAKAKNNGNLLEVSRPILSLNQKALKN